MKNFSALLLLLFLLCPPLAAQPLRVPTPEEQALIELALGGNLCGVQAMVANGVNVNAVNEQGNTALMWAAFNGHTPVVRFLLEQGVAVDAMDYIGRTALQYASSGPYPETVGYLIQQGAEVNIQDTNEHFSALMMAAAEGQLEVVRLLLDAGADAGLKDKDGDTAETFARQNGHAQVAELLATRSDP